MVNNVRSLVHTLVLDLLTSPLSTLLGIPLLQDWMSRFVQDLEGYCHQLLRANIFHHSFVIAACQADLIACSR